MRGSRASVGLFLIFNLLVAPSMAWAQDKSSAPPRAEFASGMQIIPINAPEPSTEPAKPSTSVPKPKRLGRSLTVPFGPALGTEVEPNETSATATPIAGVAGILQGNIFPNADVDFYSFTAAVGDRVYAATMTSISGSGSVDSNLDLIASDGTTVIENDNDDGSFGATSSSIAGRTITAPGTHFLRVRHTSATAQLRPYRLFFHLRSGSPTAETEANDTFPGQVLPAGGWVSGNTSATTDLDFFSVNLNAGDTVWVSVDLDPERDTVEWTGQTGLGAFGTPPQILVVNDGGAATPDSESFFMTVKAAGTYGVFVGVPTGGATFGTYHLNVDVFPAANEGVNCTTYTSTNVPVAIPTGPAIVTSTLTVPGNPIIGDLDVTLNLTHNFMADLDLQLTAPTGVGGNTVGLLSDIGSVTVGAQTTMDLTLDDESAVPSLFAVTQGLSLAPELNYRLAWFDGQPAAGTWTLTVRDDAAGDGGSLDGWSLRICEPVPAPACASGFVQTTVFTNDFEGGDGGFTHSGTADEWELGNPTFAPVTGCNSGTSCWKTDLDNTYNASSTQDLLSPNINLAGLSAPVVVSWTQKYQIESATFDHALIEAREVGNPANNVRLFDWLGATMNETVGNPGVIVQEAAGWGRASVRADAMAGLNSEVRFHLDSDTTVQLAGLAIDDVTVTACRALSADLSITKTDGAATEVPGTPVTYTIAASNAGPDPVAGGTVADTFPGTLSGCTWTCLGAGGGTCTAAGAGNISDAVNLPASGSVTYSATCTIAASATGSLSNTATVSSSVTDPVPANNSATDTDTLTPQADLAITKTDGVTAVTPGGTATYTIVTSNSGPSNAPSSSVADTFPAACTAVNWTCVGAGGGTCTAAGAGNIAETANLPAGGSVTYTAACTVSGSATGSLVNTATVTAPAGVTDPTPGNNSATDTDGISQIADLSITKTDGLTNATPGQATTYTIVASNAGPSGVTGAAVADTFPVDFTGATWTCAGAGGGTCTAGGAGNIADTVNLPSGASVTYTVNGTISGAFTGTLTNTATVSFATLLGGGPTDPNPGNNSATDTTEVASAGVITGTKTVAGTFEEGGAITYTIVLSNSSASAQLDNPGDEFTDTLPAGLTLTGASATSGTASTAGNTVTWNGSIPGNGSVTITIDATIDAGSAGLTLSNQGTFNFDADGNGTNESTGQTDDPTDTGNADPTDLVVGSTVNVLEIPTLGGMGLALLVLLLGSLGFAVIRRRS